MQFNAILLASLACIGALAADTEALKKAKEQLGKSVDAAIRYNQIEDALRKDREEKEAAIKAVTPPGLAKWSKGDEEMSVRYESFLPMGPVDSETMRIGEAFYAARCVVCHGPDGMGGSAIPPLSGSWWVAKGPEMIIPIVTQGMTGPVAVRGRVYNALCPGQPDIGERALAALASYISNSFGNKGSEVGVRSVDEIKAKHKARSILSWTPAELKSAGTVVPHDPLSIKRGAAVYARSCQSCHKPKEYSTTLLPFERKIPDSEWVAVHGALAVRSDFSDRDNADAVNFLISALKISVGQMTPQEVSLAKKKSSDFKPATDDSGAKTKPGK
jgi:mono/diheme cytochrome c family protein